MVARKYEIDMTKGSVIKNTMMFAIPLMFTNMLQLFYNAADNVVVGRWAGEQALAAVGATTTITTLLTNVFVGLSIGGSVAVSKSFGARDNEAVKRAAYTTMSFGVVGGIAAMILGQILCRWILGLMGTPADIVDLSTLYLRIIYLGLPAQLVYNFGAAILRSVGDTRRPLYILSVTGIVNVLLNLLFVIGFKMSVAGVAIATATAHYLSASAILYALVFADAPYKINLKKLKIYKNEAKTILSIGLPAGLQSAGFSLSNMVVQSAVNSFGTSTIAGRAAAGNIESFVYTSMDSFNHATLTAVSQNYGAKNEKRIYKVILAGFVCCSLFGIGLGLLTWVFGEQLLSLFVAESPAVIREGMVFIKMTGIPYFLCGIMLIMTGALRGLGHSKIPAISSLVGACLSRLLWIFFILPLCRETWVLYLCWPVSWVLVIIMHIITFITVRKKTMKKMMLQ